MRKTKWKTNKLLRNTLVTSSPKTTKKKLPKWDETLIRDEMTVFLCINLRMRLIFEKLIILFITKTTKKCRIFYVKNHLFIWNEIRQCKHFAPHYLLHSIMTNPILLNIKVHIESPERLIKMQKSHRNIDRKKQDVNPILLAYCNSSQC